MWLAKHKIVAVLFWNVLVWIPIVLFFDAFPSTRSFWWILYGIFMFLFSLLWADSNRIHVLQTAAKRSDATGDPKPLSDAIEQLRPFMKSKSDKIIISIHQSFVLCNAGKFDEALLVLKENDVDTYPGMPLAIRCNYYVNLTYIYFKLDQFDIVPFLYEKTNHLLDNLKAKPKIFNSLHFALQSTLAEYKFHQNQFDEARALLTSFQFNDLSRNNQVNFSLLMGKILIAQNNPNDAIPYLKYVLEFGYRLYETVEAKQCLEQIGHD